LISKLFIFIWLLLNLQPKLHALLLTISCQRLRECAKGTNPQNRYLGIEMPDGVPGEGSATDKPAPFCGALACLAEPNSSLSCIYHQHPSHMFPLNRRDMLYSMLPKHGIEFQNYADKYAFHKILEALLTFIQY